VYKCVTVEETEGASTTHVFTNVFYREQQQQQQRGRRDGGRDRDRGHSNHGSSDNTDDSGRSRVDRNPNPRPEGERSRSRERRERDRRRERERERDDRTSQEREESPVPIIQRRRKSGWDQIVPITEDVVVSIMQPPNILQNPQLIKQQKKLYVGNLPANVTEIEILEFFNNAMLNANATTNSGSPVVSAILNPEKAYAFLEFRTVDEATTGMNLDGITFRGQPLRIRRPKDYAPLPEGAEQPASANIQIVSTNVADTPYKIFVGGLPSHLNEGVVKPTFPNLVNHRRFWRRQETPFYVWTIKIIQLGA